MTLVEYALKRKECFKLFKTVSQAHFWKYRCGCKLCNQEAVHSSFDAAPCRAAQEIVAVSSHFSFRSPRTTCVLAGSASNTAEYKLFLKLLHPPFKMILPKDHKDHKRVFFTDECRSDMVFVIDCPANSFDLQCIVGDCGLTEAEDFLAQKRCFGLTDPINAVYSVNALTKSFWNVFGAEAKEEVSDKVDIKERIRAQLEKLKEQRTTGVVRKGKEREEENVQYKTYYPWEEYKEKDWTGRKGSYMLPRCKRVVKEGKEKKNVVDLEPHESIKSFRLMTFRQLVELDREWLRTVNYI